MVLRAFSANVTLLFSVWIATFCPIAHAYDLFILRTSSGSVERVPFDPTAGKQTLIRGLVAPLAMTQARDGCWIIGQSSADNRGNVLQFTPGQAGHARVLIDVAEGYGGQLSRPCSFAWHDGDLLVADQADGLVKRYEYPSGQWQCDVLKTNANSIELILVLKNRLYLVSRQSKAIQRTRDRLSRTQVEMGTVEDWASLPNGELPLRLLAVGDAIYCISDRGSLVQFIDHEDRTPESRVIVANHPQLVDVCDAVATDQHQFYVLPRTGKLTRWNCSGSEPQLMGDAAEITSAADVAELFVADLPPATEYVYQPSLLTEATPEKVAFFETHIRPLLHDQCIECHGEGSQEGRLRLDSRQGWQVGGRSGPAVVPGKPEESLLIQAVMHLDKDLKMPPDQRLRLVQINLLAEWIRSGAIDPRIKSSDNAQEARDPKSPTNDQATWNEEFTKRLDWWSLKPMRLDAPPTPLLTTGNQSPWSQLPIDGFIEQALNARGLAPAPSASDEVLLRRVSFVLTGLPPSPGLRSEYLDRAAQDRQAAYVWLVDEMLQSPHFGEQWARHWMDVVRYTDTYGYEWDNPAKGSHEYRDYLIRAFNQDLPFNTFVVEQLAGDLLPEPRIDRDLQINESMIGPMFYHLGEHRHGSSLAFNGIHQEMVNNKVDAFSKAFLATTVACARCHDHKREPVSQRDYYALGAMFMTPRWVSRPADAPGKNSELLGQLRSLRSTIHDELKRMWMRELERSAIVTEAALEQLYLAHSTAEKPPKLTIEDIEYPLVKLLTPGIDVAQVWEALRSEFEQSRKQRMEINQSFNSLWPKSVLAVKHSDDTAVKGQSSEPDAHESNQPLAIARENQLPDRWVMEGEGFETGWVECGEVLVALDGDRVVARLLDRGLHTHSLSSKMPGVLRMPPQHSVAGALVSLRLAGGEYSGSLVLDENTFQNETVAFFKNDQLAWRSYADQPLKNGVTRCTIDFATASLNANFPPRTGLAAGLPNNDLGFDKRSWLSVTKIVSHDQPGAPQKSLDSFLELYEHAPASREQALAHLAVWLRGPVDRWCRDQATESDCEVMNWLLQKQLLPNSLGQSPELQRLVAEYREVESRIAFPRTVNSMDERSVDKSGLYLNVRGNVDAVESLVMPASLSMFGDSTSITNDDGSGRMQLAHSLVDPEHPLLTRVYVNRVWQWVMGEGLVSTPDDFGRLGAQPTHPELLDWLARDFIRQGWSTKQLVRQLVLSQTFRQSGEVSPNARDRDPDNRWWHHYPTRRLEAESIRDSLLAVSGHLDRSLFGRPINPPRAVEDGAKRLFSGPIDGNGRRSLYLTMSIMAPPKFLTTFDLPDLKLPNGKRNITSVPAQALQMMNDPLVSEMASRWSDRLLATLHTSVEERISDMIITAYARRPRQNELELWTDLATRLSSMHAAAGPSVRASELLANQQIWSQLAQTMFNTKEFIYYR